MPLLSPEQPCIDVPERGRKLKHRDARSARHRFQRATRHEGNPRPGYHACENAVIGLHLYDPARGYSLVGKGSTYRLGESNTREASEGVVMRITSRRTFKGRSLCVTSPSLLRVKSASGPSTLTKLHQVACSFLVLKTSWHCFLSASDDRQHAHSYGRR